jgi:site-specific DNA recombinase
LFEEARMFNRVQKKWIVSGTVRAAHLARVSTVKQLDNSSPEDQLRRDREYSELKGYAVITEVVESISGSFVLARSDFQNLLEMGARGEIDVIVVDIPDRLGRGDTIAKLELLAQMHNVRIEYARPGRDVSTVEGMALKATDTLVSGIERMNIRRRTMDGKNARAREGRIIRTRFRPFGYKYAISFDDKGKINNCWLEVIDEEAEVIRQIFLMCADEGLTTYGIVKRLNDAEIPPPSAWKENGTITRIDTTLLWKRATVIKLLRSRTMMGEWRWGKREWSMIDTLEGPKSKGGRRRELNEAPIVKVPAIVDESLWYAAQNQLEANRAKFVKPAKYSYLLRSRLFCGYCGGRMAGWTDKKKNQNSYYRCWRRSSTADHKCPSKFVRRDILDGMVWDYIVEVIRDDRKLFDGLAEARQRAEKGRKIIQASIATLLSKNEKSNEDMEKLVDMHLGGDISRETFRKKKAGIEDAVVKRVEEIQDLEKRLTEYIVVSEDDENAIRKMKFGLSRRIHSPDIPLSEQMRVLEILQVKCVWSEQAQELTISGLFRGDTLSTTSWLDCQCIPFFIVLPLVPIS